MSPRELKIIELLVKVARPKIRRHFRPDSCIASTRVAVDVLAHYGIAAAPRPCRAYICNKKLWKRVKDGTFAKPFLPGEWSVGIGYEGAPQPPGGSYLGHLVALIEDGSTDILVDLSLDQASRPQKDIVLEPSVVALDRNWLTNQLYVHMPGAVIHYNPIENHDHLHSRDWTAPRRTERIVANIISLIDKKL